MELILMLLTIVSAGDGGSCDNYGTIAMVGSANEYYCNVRDEDCDNYGIIVMVGPDNQYVCDGDCHNYGLLIQVLGDYCGDRGIQVCDEELCVSATDMVDVGGTEWLPQGCTLKPGLSATWTLSCGDPHQPCGIAQQLPCWTVRYVCSNTKPVLELATGGHVTCVGHGEEGAEASQSQPVDYALQVLTQG